MQRVELTICRLTPSTSWATHNVLCNAWHGLHDKRTENPASENEDKYFEWVKNQVLCSTFDAGSYTRLQFLRAVRHSVYAHTDAPQPRQEPASTDEWRRRGQRSTGDYDCSCDVVICVIIIQCFHSPSNCCEVCLPASTADWKRLSFMRTCAFFAQAASTELWLCTLAIRSVVLTFRWYSICIIKNNVISNFWLLLIVLSSPFRLHILGRLTGTANTSDHRHDF